MEYRRMIDRRTAFIGRMQSAYSSAKMFQLTSKQLNEKTREIFAAMQAEGMPKHAQEFVRGYAAALTDELYRNDLVYGAVIKGQFYSTHRDRADYYEKHGISARQFAEEEKNNPGHYWGTDTSCAFFVE
jgi:hypothetical protein